MENIKEKIYNYLITTENKCAMFEDLKQLYCESDTNAFIDFNKSLNALIDENKIFVKNNVYYAIDNITYKIGVVDINNNRHNIIRADEKIYYINTYIKPSMEVIIEDIVIFKILYDKEVTIIHLLKASNKQFVCEAIFSKKRNSFVFYSTIINNYEIEITNKKDYQFHHKDYLLVNISRRNKNVLYCNIIQNLGQENLKGNDITKLLIENNARINFDKEVLSDLSKYNNEIEVKDFEYRKDLTNIFTCTIDGDDAKDYDDAISISKCDNHYNLKVHIADVSYYVEKDSLIDIEAYKRGTSIYVCDRVVPMLPFKLSNDLCSLKPNLNRLTLTCDMDIDFSGEIVDYKIYESIINSNYRITYNDVNKLFNNDIEITNIYKDCKLKFFDMLTLSKIIRNKRFKDGAIDFEKDEAKAILDDNGFAVDFKIRDRGHSEKMIEDFMIYANVCVAKHMKWTSIPNMYRVHKQPKEQEITKFYNYISELGYKIKGKNHTSLSLQTCLNHFQDSEEYFLVKELLLKSMQKAIYSNECLGHFGLGLLEYCHFTSPIRRYPDLLVARMIKKYIINQSNYGDFEKDDKYILKSANQCNLLERKAILIERKVDDMKKAEYMTRYINHKFKAIIVSVHKFGFFVKLDNTIEGLVRLSSFPLYLEYDNERNMFVNNDYNLIYYIGKVVNVKCCFVSKENGQIEFSLVLNKNIRKIKRWL